jgi:hypothetical protein
MAGNPMQLFPGFTAKGLVSDAVIEAATIFNTEGLDSLSGIPERALQWAEHGVRVTGGFMAGQAKIPVRLSPLHGFEPKGNVRTFNQVLLAAITAQVNPYDLNYEWPLPLQGSAVEKLYGFDGLAGDILSAARAMKPDVVASLLYEGFYSAAISGTYGSSGANGNARTIAQPGLSTGLPLFSGGIASDDTTEITARHYANPLLSGSPRFANLFYGIGKITASTCARSITTGNGAGQMSTSDPVFGTMLTRMTQVPHPSKPNMTMGLEVTHIVGPTWMKIPFLTSAIQQLSLQVGGSTYAAATSNIYNLKALKESGQADKFFGPSGFTPWEFHIAPQLDAHPYALANPGKQFWFAISTSRPNLCWAELAAPTREFTPRIVLMGENTENAQMHNKIQLLGDMAAGGAVGLPHSIQMYTETAPAS